MKIRLLTEAAYNRIITLKETMSKKDRGYGVIPVKIQISPLRFHSEAIWLINMGLKPYSTMVSGMVLTIQKPSSLQKTIYNPKHLNFVAKRNTKK